MGKRGDGYGSEDHLRGYLEVQQPGLNSAIASALDVAAEQVEWLPFLKGSKGDLEYKGIGFLERAAYGDAYSAWKDYWPRTGNPPSWDAVGRAGNDWLLVEAKSNWPEFCSPPSKAKSEESQKTIEASLNKTKQALGVHRRFQWHGTYYQHANRLAVVNFLHQHTVSARLVEVFFTGDQFPDSTFCPRHKAEWDALIEARRLTMGLPNEHKLTPFEHQVFLPALTPPGTKPVSLTFGRSNHSLR